MLKANVNTLSPNSNIVKFSSNDQKKKIQADTTLPKYIAGGTAGYGVKVVSYSLFDRIRFFCSNNLLKNVPTLLRRGDAESLISKMMLENNLYKIDIDFFSNKELQRGCIKGYVKSKKFKFFNNLPGFLKPLGKRVNKSNLKVLSRVKNTGDFFYPDLNLIKINSDHLNAAFHELGHAKDHFGKGFRSLVSKIRIPLELQTKKYILPVMFLAALTYQKSDSDKDSNILKKGRKFIHDNIGKLVFILSIPKLINEFSASKNAVDFLKKSNKIPSCNLNMFKLRYGIGFASYLMAAASLAVAVKLGVKVRDIITNQGK